MTVYLDLLVLLNTIINYLLLRGSAAMSGCPGHPGRLLGAAALGGLYAGAAMLPGLHWLQSSFWQVLFAAVILVAAFGWKRSTLRQGLFFLALSFAFSGVVLLAVQLWEPDLVLLGSRAYYAVSMPALLLLAGLCYGLAAVVLEGCGQHTGGDLVPLELTLNGATLSVRALRDTGNTLRDPVSGEAVLVLGWQQLAALLPDAQLSRASFRDPAGLLQTLSARYPRCRFRLIPYRTVGVEGGLLLAVRCTVKEPHRHPRAMLAAFTPAGLGSDSTFEALLGGVVA